jgi:hypothetical protein
MMSSIRDSDLDDGMQDVGEDDLRIHDMYRADADAALAMYGPERVAAALARVVVRTIRVESRLLRMGLASQHAQPRGCTDPSRMGP